MSEPVEQSASGSAPLRLCVEKIVEFQTSKNLNVGVRLLRQPPADGLQPVSRDFFQTAVERGAVERIEHDEAGVDFTVEPRKAFEVILADIADGAAVEHGLQHGAVEGLDHPHDLLQCDAG